MFLLGLTGDIASGKSTVATLLAARGAAVLDADALVRELYADRNFAARVVALFQAADGEASGASSSLANSSVNTPLPAPKLLAPDGSIDRAALGALVFGDAAALARLEALVHPAVSALRKRKIEMLRERTPSPPVVVVEAVKLIESGQARECGAMWWVISSPEVQRERLMRQRGLSEAQAQARLERQPSRAAKRALLGAIPLTTIENNSTIHDLEERVDAEWRRLRSAVS
jgi:dephospho-CoA kinase